MKRTLALGASLVAISGLLSGCLFDMVDQPRYKPLARSTFFADGRASRLPPAGTVPRGQLQEDTAFYTGRDAQGPLKELPVVFDAARKQAEAGTEEHFPMVFSDRDDWKAFLMRGQDRYRVFCAPCHGQDGHGQGMIVRRGMKRPPSYHEERLRTIPIGHFFDVMTNGFGVMFDYSDRINPRDRWAIAAYIRTLQLSQGVPQALLSEEDQRKLSQPATATAAETKETTQHHD